MGCVYIGTLPVVVLLKSVSDTGILSMTCPGDMEQPTAVTSP